MTVPAIETLTPTTNAVWRLDVDTSSTGEPTWVQVRAMNSFAPTLNDTTQDASDYDSDGWGSDAVTLRKWQNTATLMRKTTSADTYDAGQEALRAAADSGDLVHVRWYDRTAATAEAYEGEALVQWNPTGGDVSGLQSVNVTLLGQGARRPTANPTTAG